MSRPNPDPDSAAPFFGTALTRDYHRMVCVVLAGLLALRLCALLLSPLGLHGDEAQYWAWSKDLDWGYFTKPPMIAWVIAATTSIFGDAEWAVRLSSAPLHTLTSYLIFRTGRTLFDERTGFWAAMIYALMPALWLSSLIVSTDVPLLLCYAAALNAWVHLRNGESVRGESEGSGSGWLRAVQLGAAVGLGMLSKYAMLFFLPALFICIIFDRPTRAALLTLKGVLAALIIAAIITPNIMWNINHDFATLSHTADNANLGHSIPFHPMELLTFMATQFGVFGPLSFAALLMAMAAAFSDKLGERAKWLALFCAAPLLIICVQALLSRANANWAVTSYVAGSLLTARACVQFGPRVLNWVKTGLALQSALAMFVIGAVLLPSLSNALPILPNSVKRLRAWPATTAALQEVIAKGHEGREFEYAATDKRIVFYDLKYYGLETQLPLKMWMLHAAPSNHAELSAPLPAAHGPVLIIHYDDNHQKYLGEDFARLERLPDLDIELGGGKRRVLKVWAGYDYSPTTTR